MAEFESSSLLAASTASEEVSVSSSGEPMMTLPPPQVPTAEKKKRNLPGMPDPDPDPDAEVIALSPKSLLATNRFICEICSKGFQRDQNLQLHRRGHNLPWKLRQRKLRQRTGTEVRKRVYVCPEPTCVHHDPKWALGDLTGIKKHFCRKHGEKKWKCEWCAKKYAVQSDWKAHMKTCGIGYRCDCGSLFSRRASFITHMDLCDGLAQESARSAETLAITHPDGDLKIQTVAASSSSSPPPRPLTSSTSVLSPVLSIQSSGFRTPDEQNSSKPDPKSRGEEDSERLQLQMHQYSDATISISHRESTSGTAPDGGVSYMEESMRLNELGEVVRKQQKLSPEDKESLGRASDEVSHSSEEELMEEIWSEELEETSSDELEELNCYPMDVPPTVSHHFYILHVLDLSYTEINSLPQSISRLVALQKLYLRNCECLMQLPPEIGELTNLEVLNLDGTEIVCLPKEIANLDKLTCLRVSFYGYANQTVIPRKVLSNLSRLNELTIDVTPYGEWWDVEIEAIIDDLRSLKELRALKLYLPTAKLLEELTLIFPGLANFRFTVGQCEEHFISRLPRDNEEEFNNWEKLEKGLEYVNGDRIPNEITKVFKHVNAFFLQCHWTANSLSEFGHENLNEVKFCLVMKCNEFQTIIDSEQFYQGNNGRAKSEDFQDFDEAIVLGSLERLIVRYMKNMESIWKGPVGKGSMSSLKSLALHTCPNLTTLFTIDMLSNLINLEELIVEDCPKINSLVSLKNSGSKSGIFLPSLKKISLLELPGLVSISSGLCIAPKLERMVVFYCPKLEKLSTMDISSTNLKVIKGEEEWWNALKWYESDLSTEHEDYLTSLFIPLRRNGDLFAQLTED